MITLGTARKIVPISLIMIRDVCEGEDTRQTDIERSDQAASPTLISSSQDQCLGDTARSRSNAIVDRENEGPGSDIAESSPSLVSYSQDYGLGITEEIFRIGNIVEIHMRTTRNGSVSNRGVVTEIDVNRPNRVNTNTCHRYFLRVLKLIQRPSTSMNLKDTQSQSGCAILQSF